MIGSTLARLAIAAGIDVVMSNSRGPDSLTDLIDELGVHAHASDPAGAAQEGDLVVATIPLHAYKELPVDALAGKTVIDTMNYYPDRDGRIARLDADEVTSSELIQRHLSRSSVVKAANNIVFQHLWNLARPAGTADRSALPIAGDDESAKLRVAELLDRLGYNVVDTGSLADSWRMEPNTPVYCKPYMAVPPASLPPEDLQPWIFQSQAIPAPATSIKDLMASAARGPAGGTTMRFD